MVRCASMATYCGVTSSGISPWTIKVVYDREGLRVLVFEASRIDMYRALDHREADSIVRVVIATRGYKPLP